MNLADVPGFGLLSSDDFRDVFAYGAALLQDMQNAEFGETPEWFTLPDDVPGFERPARFQDLAVCLKRIRDQRILDQCLVPAMLCACPPEPGLREEFKKIQAWTLAATFTIHSRHPSERKSANEACRQVRLLASSFSLLQRLPIFEGSAQEIRQNLATLKDRLIVEGGYSLELSRVYGIHHLLSLAEEEGGKREHHGRKRTAKVDDGAPREIGIDLIESVHTSEVQDVRTQLGTGPLEDPMEKTDDMPIGARHQVVKNSAPRSLSTSMSYTHYYARRVANRLTVTEMSLPCDWKNLTLHEARILMAELVTPESSIDRGVRAILVLVLTLRPWAEVKALLEGESSKGKFDEELTSLHIDLGYADDPLDSDSAVVYWHQITPFRIPLAGPLPEAIQTLRDLNAEEALNTEVAARRYLSDFNRRHQTRITLGNLATYLRSRLSFYLNDPAEVGLLCGDSLRQQVPLYYHRASTDKLEGAYRQCVSDLFATPDACFLAPQERINQVTRIGSYRTLHHSTFRSFFNVLRAQLDELREERATRYFEFHNRYTWYVYQVLLLGTGYRAVTAPLETIRDFDLIRRLIYISDKESRSGLAARIVPLPDTCVKILEAYIAHLGAIADFLEPIYPEHANVFREAMTGTKGRKLLQFVTEKGALPLRPKIITEYTQDDWAFALNTNRHNLRPELSCFGVIGDQINHWMGHAPIGQEGQGPWSAMTHRDLIEIGGVVEKALERIHASDIIEGWPRQQLRPIPQLAYRTLDKRTRNLDVGRYAREKRDYREHKLVRGFAEDECGRTLTSLQQTELTDDQYWMQVMELSNTFRNELSSSYEFHIAMVVARAHVNRWNQENPKKKRPLPHVPLKIRRERQSRTEAWHYRASDAALLSKNFLSALDGPKRVTQLKTPELHCLVVFAASLYGALNGVSQLRALSQALSAREKIHTTVLAGKRICWIDFKQDKALLTNSEEGDERYTEHRWFIEPISLSLITQLYNREKVSEIGRWSFPELENEIRHTLEAVNIALPTHLGAILCHGVAVAESQPGVELSSALAEVALDRTPTVSLPASQWRYCVVPRICTVDLESQLPQLSSSAGNSEKKSIDIDGDLGEELDVISKTIKNEINRSDRKASGRHLVAALSSLKIDTWSFPSQALLKWYLHHLSSKNNKPSTTDAYHSAIAHLWMEVNSKIDLALEESESIYEVYYDVLAGTEKDGYREYRAARLQDLHRFCEVEYGIEPVVVPFNNSGHPDHVKARYIPQPLYNALLSAIPKYMTGRSDHEVEILILATILAYRTGLRRGEICKLRIRDVEDSQQGWLFVKPNMYADNKTSSSTRKVPLRVLLTDEEYGAFRRFYRRRITGGAKATELLFSLDPKNRRLIDGDSLSSTIRSVLTSLSNGEDFHFHSLRHTALSNIHLMIEEDYDLAEQMTGLPGQRCRKIVAFIVGNEESKIRRYWALARLAGHESPSMTFRHYLHFSSLLIGRKLNATEATFTYEQIRAIANVSEAQLSNSNSSSLYGYRFSVDLIEILIKRLNRIRKLEVFGSESNNEEGEALGGNTHVILEGKSRVSDREAYQVLKAYEDGGSISSLAADYGIPEARIEKWINAAKNITAILSKKGASRTVSPVRKKSLSVVLTPPLPRSISDRKDAEKILFNLRKSFREDKIEILWAVNYYLTHVKTSGAGLRFNDELLLWRFIDLFKKSARIPYYRWYVEIHIPKEKESNWSRDSYSSVENNIVKRNQSETTAYLFLKSLKLPTNSEESGVYKKYSTSALRYIVFMIGVMQFDKL